ncbi:MULTISPECIES: hypothetical protein [unclassified Myxococcus]|uniref:hypothetical protein n=1 Tax=unclassified Myxococcus TaxID=2648731 RepID=UPI0020C5F533|nr:MULTISPECIES: hypothetical protein [unclassified Myxococcus]
MAFKTALTTLALGTLFLGSSTAMAEDGSVRDWATQQARRGDDRNHDRDNDRDDNRGHQDRDNRRGHHPDRYEAHIHTGGCHHAPAPRPPSRARGRYEMQTVNRWVEGRYEKVWVPEVCEERRGRRHRVSRCSGGFYENRWVEGGYVQTTEWVWVSYERGNGWSSNRTHPASYYP